MQIDFELLENEWKAFDDIVGGVDSSLTYHIQNRGADTLIGLESDSVPESDNQAGVLVLPYKVLHYKKGAQDLYLKPFNRGCAINVTTEA